ncbi:hypothetical protein [Bradyrhizobium betae]|uniref:SGNH/GDSL hydrolase family protein n=1 Tax=Bradyrhizobium betae TaxID=244734 RepID=A0A4Q1VJC1_9BRAD|nr:hypothetical protein [Bradyrhizobium betae]RXT50654.1 hypothetical protein B5V03_06635 [Bradyrhizobium betae]
MVFGKEDGRLAIDFREIKTSIGKGQVMAAKTDAVLDVKTNAFLESFVTGPLKDAIVLLAAKRAMLREDIGELRTLALGSSHGDHGFDPQFCDESFNLCSRTQDLKHSYALYETTSKLAPNLKNIIVFYSVFSAGFFMENTRSEKILSPALNGLFSLGLKYEENRFAALSEQIRDAFIDVVIQLEGKHGFLPKWVQIITPDTYGAARRANDHLKWPSSDANQYLIKIIRLARHLKHNLCIVIPPVRSDYREAVGPRSTKLFQELMDICGEFQISSVLNCYDGVGFPDEYFGDFDHLLPEGTGPRILTRAIDARLRATSAAGPICQARS